MYMESKSSHAGIAPGAMQNEAPASQMGCRLDLGNAYRRLFEVAAADTPERLRQAHGLRYQVYCVENPFEDPSEHAAGDERDHFDAHSRQSLLLHRESGHVMGAVRLILPLPGTPDLPIADLADAPIPCPAERTAEISRFAISRASRDWLAAQLGDERQVMPYLTLGLMRAIVEMTVAAKIEYWVAVMEPTLLRLLKRFGIHFQPLGGLVDYHGRRQPCYAHAQDLLDGIHAARPAVWDVITDGGRLRPGRSATILAF